MHLEIYTVAQKAPPVGEPLFLWDFDNRTIPELVVVLVSIPEAGEELMTNEHPTLAWDSCAMHWDDQWSYTRPTIC